MLQNRKQKERIEKVKAQILVIRESISTECERTSRHIFPSSKYTYRDMTEFGSLTTTCIRCGHDFVFTISCKEKEGAFAQEVDSLYNDES